ncbi:MAG: triosephosphate isomerase [Nitrospinales bacterium]|jgi:triosephosphate isomerase
MTMPLIVGNWKMNLLTAEAAKLALGVREVVEKIKDVRVILAPSFISLHSVSRILSGSKVGLASQNFYFEKNGAYTGEVSPNMIKDAGCKYAIVGHSERRRLFGETDELINKKVLSALENDILTILCIGETGKERKAGETYKVIESQVNKALEGVDDRQLKEIIIAYEPVWAIGTGENASVGQAAEIHGLIRKIVAKKISGNEARPLTILYGGSVTPQNSRELLNNEEIDGVLVGGASLNIDSFCDIIRSAQLV